MTRKKASAPLNKRNVVVGTTKDGKELVRPRHEALFPLFCYIGVPASLAAFVISRC